MEGLVNIIVTPPALEILIIFPYYRGAVTLLLTVNLSVLIDFNISSGEVTYYLEQRALLIPYIH